mgnify:CR=1 FL=1
MSTRNQGTSSAWSGWIVFAAVIMFTPSAFIMLLPAIARQEVAFLLFAALLGVLIDRLVPPGHPEAFAEAMGELLSDSARAAQMGAAARTTVERRYATMAIARQWLDAYRQTEAAA